MTTSPIPFDLQILAEAVEYQKWSLETAMPFMGKRILEIGAGIGNMSRWLPVRDLLLLTEADLQLLPILKETVGSRFSRNDKVRVESIDLNQDWAAKLADENIDTIVSFNVLEHVQDEVGAIRTFANLLKNSKASGPKRIITLVPAHHWAHTSVDKSYGHFRRYIREDFETIRAHAAPDFHLHTQYFNLFGLPGWLAMGWIFRRSGVDLASVRAFEKICPFIKGIDNYIHSALKLPIGQSILAVMTLDEQK